MVRQTDRSVWLIKTRGKGEGEQCIHPALKFCDEVTAGGVLGGREVWGG